MCIKVTQFRKKELDSVTNKFMCEDYMKSIAVGSCKFEFII